MALNAVGFDGTITEAEWAKIMTFAGAPYVVGDSSDLVPSIAPGVDRTINVAHGIVYGYGVKVTNTLSASIQLDTVSSGTRWDLVAIRLNWTTNTATLVKVNGTAAQVYPSARLVTPGTSFDIPIALAQVTAGSQLPTALVDLRMQAAKVHTASSLLALTDMPVGTEAVIDGVRYRRELVSGTVETVLYNPRIIMGSFGLVTFDANGYAAVPHGLGFTPKRLQPSPRLGSTSKMLQVVLASGAAPLNATNAALRAYAAPTGEPWAGQITVDFTASN